MYDRVTQSETALLRNAAPPELGVNGVAFSSLDYSRLCFGFNDALSNTSLGPSRFYATDLTNPTDPASTVEVSPVVNDIGQCFFASDNRTMIYWTYTPGRIMQQAYAVDSLTP